MTKLAEAFVEATLDFSSIPAAAAQAGQAAANGMESGVKAGASKVKRAADDAGKSVGDAGAKGGKQFGDEVERGASKGSDAMKKVAQFLAAGAIAKGIKDSISAASDLNETVSKTGQVFGQDALPAMQKFADGAATGLGLSKRAALDAADSFGLLLKNLGFSADATQEQSIKLTQLAGDFASFFNTRPEDAVTAIAAAFRGETEPIRQFGIFMDDARLKTEALNLGLYSGKGNLDNYAKGQAALQIILQQSTDAQGDFARTAGGAANQQRILAAEAENAKAKIGQGLLPIYTAVLQVLGKLVGAFAALPVPIQTVVVVMGGLTALIGPIGTLVEHIKSIGPALATASPYLATAIAIVAALAIVFGDSGTIMEDNVKVTKQYTDALKDMKDGAAASFDGLRQAVLTTDQNVADISKLGTTVDQVAKALAGSPQAYGRFIESVGQAAQGSDEAQQAFERMRMTLGDIRWGEEAAAATQLNIALATLGASGLDTVLSHTTLSNEALGSLQLALQDGSVAASELSLSSGDAAMVIDTLTKAMAAQADASKGANAEVDPFASALDHAASASEQLATRLDASSTAADVFGKALQALLSPSIGLEQANLALQKASDAVIKTFEESIKTAGANGKALDEVDQKTGTLTETSRANREAIIASVEAGEKYASAMIQNGQSTEQARGFLLAYRNGLIDQITSLGGSRAAAEAYVNQLGLTPEHVDTTIQLFNDQQAKAAVEAYIKQTDGIPKEKKTEIQALIDQGKYQEAAHALGLLGNPIPVHVRPFVDASDIANIRFQVGAVRKEGGNVPGAPDAPVPILAHGGEYVLSRPVVEAIKRGGPNRQLADSIDNVRTSGVATTSSAGSGEAPVHLTIQVGDMYGPDEWIDNKLVQVQQAAISALQAGRRR